MKQADKNPSLYYPQWLVATLVVNTTGRHAYFLVVNTTSTVVVDCGCGCVYNKVVRYSSFSFFFPDITAIREVKNIPKHSTLKLGKDKR